MRLTLVDVIRATAECGITSPNESIVQHLVANGYEIPDDIECLLAEAVGQMLAPPPASAFIEEPLLTTANVAEEIRRRRLVWNWQAVPTRKYVLLVADYLQINPFVGSGPFERREVSQYGRRLLAWLGNYFDPLATDASRATVLEKVARADSARRSGPRNPLDAHVSEIDDNIVHGLRMALTDTERAISSWLFDWDELRDDCNLLLEIVDCLWPASWDRGAPPWSPPREAVDWAGRISREGTFGDLPILADMLEDAGCSDRPLLDHCRNHPRHHRGCAALDRILGCEQRPASGVERVSTGASIRLMGLTDKLGGYEWSSDSSFEIGRNSGAVLAQHVPGTENVSRRHASVCRNEGGWWVTDLGSFNGTFVNGVRVGTEQAKPLFDGDILQCADIALRVNFSAPDC